MLRRIPLFILSLCSWPILASSPECDIRFEVLCDELDTFLIEFYNADYELVFVTSDRSGQFSCNFEDENPTSLFVAVNGDWIRPNAIIIDTTNLHFKIDVCDPLHFKFENSTSNSTYQKFLAEEHRIKSNEYALFKTLTDRINPADKSTKDSLSTEYKKARAIAEAEILRHENHYITKYSSSYLSLFLLNETLKFREREKATDYATLVENLDSVRLHHYDLYHEIRRTVGLRPYVAGDTIESSDKVVNVAGDSISLATIVKSEGYVFLFLWHRSCPHCLRLLDALKDDSQTRGAYRGKVVAINDESKLSREDRLEIQSEVRFSCYFYDQSATKDLLDKFWVKFSPFGVILQDGKIVKLACHFDDFVEMTN